VCPRERRRRREVDGGGRGGDADGGGGGGRGARGQGAAQGQVRAARAQRRPGEAARGRQEARRRRGGQEAAAVLHRLQRMPSTGSGPGASFPRCRRGVLRGAGRGQRMRHPLRIECFLVLLSRINQRFIELCTCNVIVVVTPLVHFVSSGTRAFNDQMALYVMNIYDIDVDSVK
jgi:hypothetical protein